MTNTRLAAALQYVRLGLSVIPLHSPGMPLPAGRDQERAGKAPLIGWRDYQRRLPSEEEVRQWWAQWPRANVGAVTGKVSGVIVLDVDGPEGQTSLRRFAPIPITWRSTTGRGEHHWFRHPGFEVHNFAKKVAGLDMRGDGGYVVAPGSRHRNGLEYRWAIPPDQADLAEAPGWLLGLIGRPSDHAHGAADSEARWWLRLLQGAKQGERHDVAVRIAGHYLGIGREPEEVEAMLLGFAARCSPPHDDQDIRQIVMDLAQKERQKRASGDGGAKAEHSGETDHGKEAHLTDLGNARRLVRQHGHDLHYCPELGGWLVWAGARWEKDATAKVMRLAKETVSHMYHQEAEGLVAEKKLAMAKWAIQSEADRRLVAMLHLTESEPMIPAVANDFDRDTWGLNVLNGTVNLRTGQLRPHRREDLITKVAPVIYDEAAECPLWEDFLDRVLPKPELRRFLQKALGYALTGDVREQVLIILWGTGANGKTTLVRTLMGLLGDYACQTSSDTLLVRRGDHVRNDVARLRGARLVAALEVEGGGRRLAEALVKQLTGEDRLTARFLYHEFFEFDPTFKLFLAVNHKPEIRGTDHAIWRRVRLIPFTVTIPDDEQDKTLREKLSQERSGILNWAIRGCRLWQEEGLAAPEEVKKATASYREEMDIFGRFLSERCAADPKGEETAKVLYQAYLSWAYEAGEKKPVSKTKFGILLGERGFVRAEKSDGTRVWKGLSLERVEPKEPDWVTRDE